MRFDPTDSATAMGPLVTQQHLAKVRSYTEPLTDAEVLFRGEAPSGKGWWHPAMIVRADAGSPVCTDEIFGPVAAMIPFDDEADAVRIANDISYGLSSYVWTENIGRAHRVAAAIEAGMCFVNSQNVRDLRQPFGGTKASGTGREGGTWSYEVFCEPKNVAVSMGSHHIPHWGV